MSDDPSSAPATPTVHPLGAVLTASEVLGVHPAADWSRWIARGHAPPAGTGNGHDTSWLDDLAQLAGLGFNEVAITLEWAALEPRPGHRNESQAEHYREVLMAARQLGMAPWVCLIDGTLPGWFAEDERGFLDDRARTLLWPRHLDWMGEWYADLVAGWIPQREAIHHAIRNHLLALGPPGERDLDETAKAVRASVLADGEAWRVLGGSAPVALYQTARLFVPTPDNLPAIERARWLDGLHRRSWGEALAEGVVGVDGYPTSVNHLREAFDRVIVQLRPPVRIDALGTWSPMPLGFLAEGLLTAFERTIEPLPESEVVAAADLAPVDDDGDAQAEHLRALQDGVIERGGAGWWQTSPIDGWQWERGFDGRSGIIDIDRRERNVASIFSAFD